jgi:hypothetical protein
MKLFPAQIAASLIRLHHHPPHRILSTLESRCCLLHPHRSRNLNSIPNTNTNTNSFNPSRPCDPSHRQRPSMAVPLL